MSKNLIIGIVAVVLLGGGALYVFNKSATVKPTPVVQDQQIAPAASATSQPASATQNQSKPPVTKSTLSRAAATASISGVQMSNGLAASGAALKSVAAFSPTTPIIYAVLILKNATQLTQLSYIRYYNGKYVDSKVSHPSKDSVKYFHFDWALNAGQTRKTGNYSLVFYVDGKKAQTVNYSIR